MAGSAVQFHENPRLLVENICPCAGGNGRLPPASGKSMSSLDIAAEDPLQSALNPVQVVQNLPEACPGPDSATPPQTAPQPGDRGQSQAQGVGENLHQSLSRQLLTHIDESILDRDQAGRPSGAIDASDLVPADHGPRARSRPTVVRHPGLDLPDLSTQAVKEQRRLATDGIGLTDAERGCPDPLLGAVMPRGSVVQALRGPMPVAIAHHPAPGLLGEAGLFRLAGGEQVLLLRCRDPQRLGWYLSAMHTPHRGGQQPCVVTLPGRCGQP